MAATHLVVVVGTRPEAIKLGPVIQAIDREPAFRRTVVATGQHRELVGTTLEAFGLVPDVHLEIERSNQGLHDLTTGVISAFAALLDRAAPDAVVVQGDTTSAMATSLTASHDRIPVAHVEAGLRTGDRANPFPEEANRRLIAVVADLHLAPTARARSALLNEGVAPIDVVVTGNTVIDAMLATLKAGVIGPDHDVVSDLLDRPPLLLVTLHRRESWDTDLGSIAAAVAEVAAHHPDLQVVLPLHPNPRVREALVPILSGTKNLRLTPPLSYPTFVRTLASAAVVLTDSGGVQEEAPSFGIPVLVARRATERTEGIDAGTSQLIGLSREAVVDAIEAALKVAELDSTTRTIRPSPFGDGLAADRVVQALAWRLLQDRPRPADFAAPVVETPVNS